MTAQEIRRAVLEVMNIKLGKARHEDDTRMHISQIESALRYAGYKVEDAQVMQAVHYLKEAGMLKRTQQTKTIKPVALRGSSSRYHVGSGIKHTDYWYTLRQKAIDEQRGETEYSKKPFAPLQNIQINTSNAPVIVGSNNNVSNHVTVFNQLDQLAQTISESADISVEDRQDAASDIAGIKQQLAKPNPTQAVVDLLWKNVARVADIAGAGALAVEIVKGIAAITGHPIG
jgi:hypothetical protein